MFVWRNFVQDDLAFWILATVWLASSPLAHVAGAALLLLSFWCIYEQGYIENDYMAAHHEGAEGKLPAGYDDAWSNETAAWTWALLLMAPALFLFQYAGSLAYEHWMVAVAPWVGLLALTRMSFWAYNRLAPSSRTLLYPVLCICRNFGLIAVVAIAPAGMLLLCAHMIARCIPYYIYRALPKSAWPVTPIRLIQAALFVLLIVAYEIGRGTPEMLFSPALVVMIGWCLLRARRDIQARIGGIELLASARTRSLRPTARPAQGMRRRSG